MRIIYHDGFDRALDPGMDPGDNLSGAYYLRDQGWPSIGAFGNGIIWVPGRRDGGGAMGIQESSSFAYRCGILAGAPRITGPRDDLKRVIVGGAWQINDEGRDTKMWGIGDDDYGVRVLMTWKFATDSIEIKDATDTVIGTATGVWDGSEWAYFEIDATRNDTTGSVVVWMDGTEILNLTNVNTGDETYGYTAVDIGPGDAYMDDFYVMDPEGADGDTVRLGSVASVGLNPSEDSEVDFTPLSGTDNFAMLSVLDNDADASYNSTSTTGHTDLFVYPIPAETLGVVSVRVLPYCRRPSGGAAQVQAVTKIDSTEYTQTAQNTGDSVYTTIHKQWQDNPDTSAAWTKADLEAATFGYKTASQTDPLRVTMCVVEVLCYLSEPIEPAVMTVETGSVAGGVGPQCNFPMSLTTSIGAKADKIVPNFPFLFQTWADLDAAGGGSLPTDELNPDGLTVETLTATTRALAMDIPTLILFETNTGVASTVLFREETSLATVTGVAGRLLMLTDGRPEIVASGRYRR